MSVQARTLLFVMGVAALATYKQLLFRQKLQNGSLSFSDINIQLSIPGRVDMDAFTETDVQRASCGRTSLFSRNKDDQQEI